MSLTTDVVIFRLRDEVARLTRERDAAIERANTNAAMVEALKAEIDAAWFSIDHGWDIESREELERQSKTNGFKYGLAQAVHHMWKRPRRAQEARDGE